MTLLLHPAKRLKNAHRYIVVLKNLMQKSGLVKPAKGFRFIRDGISTSNIPLESRRKHFIKRGILQTLIKLGINESLVYNTWDFTTASLTSSNYLAMLKINIL